MKDTSIKKVLVLGSGALKIGPLHMQKADSGVWRQELLCGPEDS